MAHKQQTFPSHSSGGWRLRSGAGMVKTLLLVAEPHFLILSSQGGDRVRPGWGLSSLKH